MKSKATQDQATVQLKIIVTQGFNLAATMSFIDPFRAANYLEGKPLFNWGLYSESNGSCLSSSGVSVATKAVHEMPDVWEGILLVSSSWTPEAHATQALLSKLRKVARRNMVIAGIDTGAFILAEAGLLSGRSATVHYEHMDAFQELYPDVTCTEALFEIDGDRLSCCGGAASVDFALHILQGTHGNAVANAAARYVFHPTLRERGAPQNPQQAEPLGAYVPASVRRAIKVMEENLEDPIPISEICREVKISQRQLDRMFAKYLQKTPKLYYRDIRLDRARGLVTQTSLPMSEIAIACGFSSQVYLSRAYKERFGLPPSKDRIEGRVPFEFRAWPMHRSPMCEE